MRRLIGSALAVFALGGTALDWAAARQVQATPQPAPRAGAAPAAERSLPATHLPVPTAALLPATQALFDGYVRTNKMPGIVGGFGSGDAPTLYVQAGRIADGAAAPAADADSLWRVYSMTKPVTAMAAMILIEEGKLRLDQPLSDFFPAFAHMQVLTHPDTSLESVPATHPILIRNLLTHTAGLGYSIITKGPLLHEYEAKGLLPGALDAKTEVQARAVRPATLQAFAERVATAPLIADPGTKWSYSIGMDVMGAVIERASGMPFDRFVNTRIFAPLRMTSSYWTVPAGQARRLATDYAWLGDNRVPLDPGATSVWLSPPEFPYGGAGLVMSARDYDRFLHMIQDDGALDGVRIARPATIALMTSNLLPAGVVFSGVGGATGGTPAGGPLMGYGAGGSVYLRDANGFTKGTYGWGGAAGTIAWVDRAGAKRGTVMVNYMPGDHWPIRAELAKALGADAARFGR